ncbi:hypothetical protein I302_100344 [Kwoniella bestiolae CBS 10118]|uniref:Uncharacterized protein n=1 Tax=Kwoniella bestiolae CBS 10118 TaxID=1296100 RepID=A0A1B9G4S3_9TREE|nr:hypothetical protein I302_03716 [Kwoniella bestiolae CBS 10118]OCF26039.1 hypothetical protein I302_03716 [Kwoniella bestiolae CBS 10118]
MASTKEGHSTGSSGSAPGSSLHHPLNYVPGRIIELPKSPPPSGSSNTEASTNNQERNPKPKRRPHFGNTSRASSNDRQGGSHGSSGPWVSTSKINSAKESIDRTRRDQFSTGSTSNSSRRPPSPSVEDCPEPDNTNHNTGEDIPSSWYGRSRGARSATSSDTQSEGDPVRGRSTEMGAGDNSRNGHSTESSHRAPWPPKRTQRAHTPYHKDILSGPESSDDSKEPTPSIDDSHSMSGAHPDARKSRRRRVRDFSSRRNSYEDIRRGRSPAGVNHRPHMSSLNDTTHSKRARRKSRERRWRSNDTTSGSAADISEGTGRRYHSSSYGGDTRPNMADFSDNSGPPPRMHHPYHGYGGRPPTWRHPSVGGFGQPPRPPGPPGYPNSSIMGWGHPGYAWIQPPSGWERSIETQPGSWSRTSARLQECLKPLTTARLAIEETKFGAARGAISNAPTTASNNVPLGASQPSIGPLSSFGNRLDPDNPHLPWPHTRVTTYQGRRVVIPSGQTLQEALSTQGIHSTLPFGVSEADLSSRFPVNRTVRLPTDTGGVFPLSVPAGSSVWEVLQALETTGQL